MRWTDTTRIAAALLAATIAPGAAGAAELNLSPFGTSSIVDGGFANGTTVINPQGGNDGSTGTMFHTNNTGIGSWSVALPAASDLIRVEIVNRADGSAPERLTGALVEVLDASNSVIASTVLSGSYGVGQVVSFDNSGLGFADAASVRISHSSNFLHAAEVRAIADSIATGKPTSGAAAFGFPTSRGNDGVFGNFSHGDNNTTDFWQVDLGSLHVVDWVSIVGRASFAARTNGATLSLLGPDGKTVIASSTVAGLAAGGPGYGSHSMTGTYSGVRYIKVQGVNYLHVGELAAIGDAYSAPQAVALQNATATLSQSVGFNLPIGQAIDGVTSGQNGWGNNNGGSSGGNNAAFETVSDLEFGEAILKFTMTFNSFSDHGFGRFRLYATTADRSEFADGLANGGDVSFTGGDLGSWFLLDDLVGFSATSGLLLAGGALQGDGSFLIDDTLNPASDTYSIWLRTTVSGITGFRLELLNDASLSGNGPGLSNSNGNSVLTEFAVSYQAIPAPAALSAALALAGFAAARRSRNRSAR